MKRREEEMIEVRRETREEEIREERRKGDRRREDGCNRLSLKTLIYAGKEVDFFFFFFFSLSLYFLYEAFISSQLNHLFYYHLLIFDIFLLTLFYLILFCSLFPA